MSAWLNSDHAIPILFLACYCLSFVSLILIVKTLFKLANQYRTDLQLPAPPIRIPISISGPFISGIHYGAYAAASPTHLFLFNRIPLIPNLAIPWRDFEIAPPRVPLPFFRTRLVLRYQAAVIRMSRPKLETLLNQSGIGIGPLLGTTPLTPEPSSRTEIFIRPRHH
jgi:hypothetical protein